MLVEEARVINTDRSFEMGDVATASKAQYEFRDYTFWNADTLKRSLNRYHTHFAPITLGLGQLVKEDEVVSKDLANRGLDPVLYLPAVFQTRTIGEKSVNTLQEWECVVIEITDTHVFSQATSMLYPEQEQNYLEIPLEEFQLADRVKLREGIVFRLIIGFVRKPSGTRTREAIIYIRHQLPRSDRDLTPLLSILADE